MQREELNVGNAERCLSVITGTALAAYGLKRRSIGGLVLGGIGAALLWRGATGKCPIYESLGLSTAENEEGRQVNVAYGEGIRVDQAITVNASPAEVYSFWRKHLESEWEAEVINEIPNELIGWRSVDGSRVRNAGSVHFKPTTRGTRVKVEVLYDPSGEDPSMQVREDLLRFKTLVEKGVMRP